MKNPKIYIVATAILLCGICLLVVGFAMSGFKISSLSVSGYYTEKSYESSESITKISVKDENFSVKITKSEDETLRVIYNENDKEIYQISEENGVFTMTKVDTRKWYEYIFNIDFSFPPALEIAVPSNFSGEIQIKTNNGYIKIADIEASRIGFHSSNGKIIVENVVVGGDLDATTSNSLIELKNCTVAGNIFADTSNGALRIENTSAANIRAGTDNGDVKFQKVTAVEIDLKTSNGAVIVEDVSASKSIIMKTSNGKISGTLGGKSSDYKITSKTSNGSNSLPENFGSGEINLNVKTSNGSINLTFLGDEE